MIDTHQDGTDISVKELSLKIAGAQRDYTTAYNIGIAESYAALERRTPQYLFDLHKRLTVWRKNSDMSSGMFSYSVPR